MFTLDFRIGLHHLPHQPKHIQVEDVDTIDRMYCKERGIRDNYRAKLWKDDKFYICCLLRVDGLVGVQYRI